MHTGSLSGASAVATNSVAKQANSNIETKVETKANDQAKAEGAQLVDTIQKSGSVVDVKA